MNLQIINLIKDNFILIAFVILMLLRIIPPEWAGFWKYQNNKESDGRAPKISFLRLVLHNLIDSILSAALIPLMAAFGFKNIITLIIFIVVGFDIFFRHQISGEAITLVGVGIIALYLDRLIETGKHIKLFGGLLTWDKDEKPAGENSESKDNRNQSK